MIFTCTNHLHRQSIFFKNLYYCDISREALLTFLAWRCGLDTERWSKLCSQRFFINLYSKDAMGWKKKSLVSREYILEILSIVTEMIWRLAATNHFLNQCWVYSVGWFAILRKSVDFKWFSLGEWVHNNGFQLVVMTIARKLIGYLRVISWKFQISMVWKFHVESSC